ncbi:unnamed protein product [Calypogeia fissa]
MNGRRAGGQSLFSPRGRNPGRHMEDEQWNSGGFGNTNFASRSNPLWADQMEHEHSHSAAKEMPFLIWTPP